jgi:hypothetical protein
MARNSTTKRAENLLVITKERVSAIVPAFITSGATKAANKEATKEDILASEEGNYFDVDMVNAWAAYAVKEVSAKDERATAAKKAFVTKQVKDIPSSITVKPTAQIKVAPAVKQAAATSAPVQTQLI